MSLAVVAYPELTTDDYDRIQAFREANDELYFHMVEPHFTLVFPITGMEEDPFVSEIQDQIEGFQRYKFCLRCTVLNKDAFIDTYHVFLVPDEGYTQMVKLHDKLYAGKLFPHRLLEIDFIPHLGIGNAKDPLECLNMINYWNSRDFAIPGQISKLDIVRLEDNTVNTILHIPLSR
jgi:hypothetical protein